MDIVTTSPQTPLSAVMAIAADKKMPPAMQYELMERIGRWTNSPETQAQLAELYRLHKNVPLNHRWEAIPSEEAKKDPKILAAIAANNRARGELTPQKLLLYIAFNDGPPDNRQEAKHSYARSQHLIYVQYPYVEKVTLLKRDPNTGNNVMAPEPFEHFMSHEVEHALQNLRARFGNGPNLTTPCAEELATATERKYVETLNQALPVGSKLPIRETYTDPDDTLKRALGKISEDKDTMDTILHSFQAWRTKFAAPGVVTSYAPAILMNAGCKGISDDGLLARTRKLLTDNGIRNGIFNRPISDDEMLKWIDNGLKQKHLGKYDVYR